jgi:hypothetical protein
METWTEEEEESATEATGREFVASEEHDWDMRGGRLKGRGCKSERESKERNLKRLEEECADIISKIPSVLDEEKLNDTRENVRLMTDHILYVNEQARLFFQEYDAIHEDLLQKLKGHLIQLLEFMNQIESKN